MKKLISVMLSLVLVLVGILPCLTNLKATASNPNLITDGTFESYTSGTAITNSEFHWISGNDFANRIYAQSLIAATTYVEVVVPEYLPGDINGDDEVNGKDLTQLRRYLADWDVTVNEPALDVNADGDVNSKDVTYLARHFADWAGYETLPTVAIKKTSFTPELSVENNSVTTHIYLNDVEALNGNVAGYELTITFDSTKLEFASHTLPALFLGGVNEIEPGVLKVVGYADGGLNTDMLLNQITFNVKDGATGETTIVVTVDEITNEEGTIYTQNYEGGRVSVIL